ncbi:hypothetical protein IFR05_010351 [Cadophora sp. M221]|nr:hypothetical protein IFR05_010351 [Cadophora sp. M221]
MQFTASIVAAILLATAPALGFIVPEGAEDGIYTVERDASGQEVHIRQGDSSSGAVARAVRGSNLKRGGLDQWGCFKDQSELDHGNCDSAVRALRDQIGDGGRGVDQSESNTGITNLCGWYKPGYAYNSGAHLTYGYQHKSYSWCPEH